jgi:hypothetical protein
MHRKLIFPILGILFVISLFACGHNSPLTPTITVGQVHGDTLITTKKPTPVPSRTFIPTYTFLIPTISSEGERIIIGNDVGRYYQYSIKAQEISTMLFTAKCIMMQDGVIIICQKNNDVLLYDLKFGIQKILPIPVDSWDLTPDRDTLYYVIKNGDIQDLIIYDIKTGNTNNVARINKQEWTMVPTPTGYWLEFPKPSKYGNPIGIYVDTYKSPVAYYRVEINSQTNIISPFEIGSNGYLTDNITVSPYRPIIGVGSTKKFPEDVTRCTTTIFSIYNITTGETTPIIEAPEGECFDYFNLYSNNIWSPDGNKVVLTTPKHICIADIEKRTHSCLEYASEALIDHIAWSPDSQHIVYIITESSSATKNIIASPIDDLSQIVFNQEYIISGPVIDLIWLKP